MFCSLIEFFSYNYFNIAFNFKGKSRAQNLKVLGDRRGKEEKKLDLSGLIPLLRLQKEKLRSVSSRKYL